MNDSDSQQRRSYGIAHVAILLAIVAFWMVTLRDGHDWGGDFSQYLQHAKNLAQGNPYSESGYVYNPRNNVVGPRAYPPGFPAILAPVFFVRGYDLFALKCELIFLFATTVLVTTRLFSRDLTSWQSLVFAALLGFSPAFWQIKEDLISEHLFIPLWYLTILVADRWYRKRETGGSPLFHGLLLGIAISMTCATRTVGIVLLPSVVVSEFLATRRLTRFGLVALGTAGFFIVVQKILLPESGGGYTEQLAMISLASIKKNLVANAVSIGNLWENGYSMRLAIAVTALTSLVAALQFCRDNWPKPTFLGIACVFYLALITIWPTASGLRLSLPLLPAILFYVLKGIGQLSANPGKQKLLLAGFCFFMVVNYSAWYSAADYGSIEGIEDPAAIELLKFIESEAKDEDVCLFFKPRVAAFFAHCRASAYPLVTSDADFLDFLDESHATLLVARRGTTDFPESLVAGAVGPPFVKVWENAQFQAVRVASADPGEGH